MNFTFEVNCICEELSAPFVVLLRFRLKFHYICGPAVNDAVINTRTIRELNIKSVAIKIYRCDKSLHPTELFALFITFNKAIDFVSSFQFLTPNLTMCPHFLQFDFRDLVIQLMHNVIKVEK
jgi:hypothetical protein